MFSIFQIQNIVFYGHTILLHILYFWPGHIWCSTSTTFRIATEESHMMNTRCQRQLWLGNEPLELHVLTVLCSWYHVHDRLQSPNLQMSLFKEETCNP